MKKPRLDGEEARVGGGQMVRDRPLVMEYLATSKNRLATSKNDRGTFS
jgi:hypothetical protein